MLHKDFAYLKYLLRVYDLVDVNLNLMSCFAPNMNQAVLDLIS